MSVYNAILSEYQRVMGWRLVPKEFGYNNQHISSVYNIVYDTLSKFKSAPN